VAKSRTQIAREHVARLRRKAQAYDKIIDTINALADYAPDEQTRVIAKRILEKEELAVQE
jgi:hypothetical protein